MRPGHAPLLAALVLTGLVLAVPPSEAEGPGPELERTAHDLARVCAGEAGLDTSTADCGAIHAVLEDRAARMGVGYRTALRWYAGRHVDRSRADRRRWVAWLRRDTRRPEAWPSRLSWSAHRGRWRDLLTLAGQYIRGELRHACAETPHHWGAAYGIDLRRARAAGWDRVDCGDTRNLYWRVPAFGDRGPRAAGARPGPGRGPS